MSDLRALVLLSGGVDSAVAALIATEECAEVSFLSFDYAQLNHKELECSRRLAERFGGVHRVQPLDFSLLAASRRSRLLSGAAEAIDEDYGFYVPGRNIIFLAHAAAYAEVNDLDRIYVGSNIQDAMGHDGRGGYPDSGPSFIALSQQVLRAGLKYRSDLEVCAPLLSMNKYQAIRYGHERGLDFTLTWSCYLNEPRACGTCPACQARLLNFHWAGLIDPVEYRVPFYDVLFDALASRLGR